MLPRLQRVGALGAFCWCFPDYHESLWDRPPCDFQAHERWFGLWRPDGSLKPMGKVVGGLREVERPTVREPEKTVKLPVSPDEYYREPSRYMPGAVRAVRNALTHQRATGVPPVLAIRQTKLFGCPRTPGTGGTPVARLCLIATFA